MSDILQTDDPIAFLLKRGNDSLKSAEALLELDLTLDALSRAYYAALHYARALLLSIDIVPKSHKGTLTLFSLHFIKTGVIPKKVGVILSILQKIREDADYEIGMYYDRAEALRLLEDTRLFCDSVAEVLPRPDGSGILQ